MKLNYLYVFIFITLLTNQSFAQSLVKYKLLENKVGYVSGGSTCFEYLVKKGVDYRLNEFQCFLDYNNNFYRIYTVEQQADLIYFEEYYDTLNTILKTQGYYRLVFVNREIGYCWLKDLIWNTFDVNGVLQKKEYYERDKTEETPAMPQPQNKN